MERLPHWLLKDTWRRQHGAAKRKTEETENWLEQTLHFVPGCILVGSFCEFWIVSIRFDILLSPVCFDVISRRLFVGVPWRIVSGRCLGFLVACFAFVFCLQPPVLAGVMVLPHRVGLFFSFSSGLTPRGSYTHTRVMLVGCSPSARMVVVYAIG